MECERAILCENRLGLEWFHDFRPPLRIISISLRKHHPPRRRLPCHHAFPRLLLPVEWNAADRRFRLGGDAVFGFAGAVPVGVEEAAGFLILLLELVVGIHFEAVGVAELSGPLEEVGLIVV